MIHFNYSIDQESQLPKFFGPHCSGPVSDCTRQYRGTTVGTIIQIENIAFCNHLQLPVIGREFIDKRDFYNIPSESSCIEVFKVSKLSNLSRSEHCQKLLQ